MNRRARLTMACLAFLLSIFTFAAYTNAQTVDIPDLEPSKGSDMTMPQKGRVRAPELTGGRGWLNTDRPLTIQNLRGKFVLLDFWTYGCINCIHIIPDLKKLEAKYPNNLVVIGVHSAKFENEKETDNIRQVILRYEIEHPVVNDADFKIWSAYAVDAWPTQVLIAPDGYVIGKVAGEGNYDLLDETIGNLVAEYRQRGQLDEQPLKTALERAKTAPLPLAFPGKVLADEKRKRLFIADSNHNRIVIAKMDGTVTHTIGTGEQGRTDGAFDRATFFRPQGMALDSATDTLYVADTENHLIRAIDLKARAVKIIAGTGEQLRERFEEGAALESKLSSPWDLQLVGKNLYVAMAGPHQIWRIDLEKMRASVFAGSLQWREARTDGARLESAFAQPSGLATDGTTLFVADAESNIIRAVDLAPDKGAVRTIVGGDLFEFGDKDGEGDDARLQHPLGVVFTDGAVFVADTYNHKIKRLDPQTQTLTTFAGIGKPGQADGATASFYEPGGVSTAFGKLYIADTNNHAIRTIDLRTKQVATLALKDLRAPDAMTQATAALTNQNADITANANEVMLPAQRVQAGVATALVVNVKLPDGYHLNASAPQRLQLVVTKGAENLKFEEDKTTLTRAAKDLLLPLRLPLRAVSNGTSELRIALTLYYCREDNTGTCRIKSLVWRLPVIADADKSAPQEVRVEGEIKL